MKTLFTLILSFLAIHFISAQEVTVNKDLTVDRTLNAAEIVVDSLFPALRFKVNGAYKFNFDYVESNDRFIFSNGTGIPMEIIGHETHIDKLNLENSLTLEGSSKNYELNNSNDTLMLQEEGMAPALGIHGEKVFLKQEENSTVNSRRKLELNPDGSIITQNIDTLFIPPSAFQGPNSEFLGAFVRGFGGSSNYIYANVELEHGVKIKQMFFITRNESNTSLECEFHRVNNTFANIGQPASDQTIASTSISNPGTDRFILSVNFQNNNIIDRDNSYYIRIRLFGASTWTIEEVHGVYITYEY